jgi:hypothetical protein
MNTSRKKHSARSRSHVQPSLRGALLSAEARLRAKADATKQSILCLLHSPRDGLLRGACHRARIRATRWLAMTLLGCLKIESSSVVPAKAGTHNHSRSCGAKAVEQRLSTQAPRRRDERSCAHARGPGLRRDDIESRRRFQCTNRRYRAYSWSGFLPPMVFSLANTASTLRSSRCFSDGSNSGSFLVVSEAGSKVAPP